MVPLVHRYVYHMRYLKSMCGYACLCYFLHVRMQTFVWSDKKPQEFVFPCTRNNAEESVVVKAFVGEASDSFDDTGTVLWFVCA